jgi:hypothetical protein
MCDSVPIAETIQEFLNAFVLISEYFDGSLDLSPALMLDEPWFLIADYDEDGTLNYAEIHFANPEDFDPEDPDSFQYSYEVRHRALRIKDEYTAARVGDGCGNTFCVIFANENQHEEPSHG